MSKVRMVISSIKLGLSQNAKRNMMINQQILGIRSVVNRGSNFHWG